VIVCKTLFPFPEFKFIEDSGRRRGRKKGEKEQKIEESRRKQKKRKGERCLKNGDTCLKNGDRQIIKERACIGVAVAVE